jgi:DNA-binding GntR family transcriptional regulator
MMSVMTTDDVAVGRLETETIRSQIGRILRAQIIAGLLAPGQLYTIRRISESHDVSPTPVREAVAQLADEGLVTLSRNRGFTIRELTEKDLDDILQIRMMLEPDAVAQIAGRRLLADPEPLLALARKVTQHAVEGDWVGFLDLDRDLHLGLLSLLGNDRLVRTVGQLRDHARLYGLRKAAGSSEFRKSADEHEELIRLVAEGRAEEARQLMIGHLRHARGIWAGREESRGAESGS